MRCDLLPSIIWFTLSPILLYLLDYISSIILSAYRNQLAKMATIDPTTTDYEPHPLTDEGYNASAGALTELTTLAENKNQPPKSHIHGSSVSQEAHAWLSKHLPVKTIESVESKFHLGNYVIDRQTGEKTFEAMSIYVRVGMHLLYYGSEQEKALHWKKTLELLKVCMISQIRWTYANISSRTKVLRWAENMIARNLNSTLSRSSNPSTYNQPSTKW